MSASNFGQMRRRAYNPDQSSNQFSTQWRNPGDVFSILLILGGDVVSRALAQLAGSRITPVAFSFGWVAYAINAVVAVVGENKLMPSPDCPCLVINGRSGYVRDNTSWVIGRMVRDFEYWMDDGEPAGKIRARLEELLDEKWKINRADAEKKKPGSGQHVKRPKKAGLCISLFRAGPSSRRYPGYDLVYWTGFATGLLQLGISAIPCGLFGDWSILLVTAAGILLAFATGSLSQWSEEKWSCRRNDEKDVVLTRGNGSQHAIVILGGEGGFDLEDLAASQTNLEATASQGTMVRVTLLAVFWILLLVCAAGLKNNTWFLLAVGCVGILQNIFVAAQRRKPSAYGIQLTFVEVIGRPKTMDALYAVETDYPRVGHCMLETFFPGKLRPDEVAKWEGFEKEAAAVDLARKKAA